MSYRSGTLQSGSHNLFVIAAQSIFFFAFICFARDKFSICVILGSVRSCKLCSFTPVTLVNSTPRDLIITACNKYSDGISMLVRSLRTSGCAAQIVILTTEGVLLPEYLYDCDIRQVIVSPQTYRPTASPAKIRWEWYYNFLRDHYKEYDRILHVDAFDVFALGDPFSLAPHKDTLYFIMEGENIGNCPYNNRWANECHTIPNKREFNRHTISCSGSLIGGSKQFFEFVELMVTQPEYPLCWGRGFDQGDFNYVLYEKFNKGNVKTKAEYIGCDDGFTTMQYCMNSSRIFDQNGNVLSKGQHKVVVAHQYNRFPDVQKAFHSKCKVFLPTNQGSHNDISDM